MKHDNKPTLRTRTSRISVHSRVSSVPQPRSHIAKGNRSSQAIPARTRKLIRDYLAAGVFALCSIIIVIAYMTGDVAMIDKVLTYTFTQFTLILNYYFPRNDAK